MRGICPNCETERELSAFDGAEDIELRGERIRVSVHFLKCQHCDTEFPDPDSPYDALEAAYLEYRKRHGLLMPQDIRNFRRRLGLTQRELSEILGWGGATLSRYENGALQDEAHDRQLRLAMDPGATLRLLEGVPQAVRSPAVLALANRLKGEARAAASSLRGFLEDSLGGLPADEFSGYRALDLDKLFSSVLFFATGGGVVKTALNKMLFYADFKNYKEFATSITGERYAHAPYGPVPDKFQTVYDALCEDGALAAEERPCGEFVIEVLVARAPVSPTMFSPSELRVLATVKERLQHQSAAALTAMSHQEEGFRQTRDGQLISYEHARAIGW